MVLRNLDAAYNLARWLLGNDADAQDAVQESSIRAYEALHTFRGSDPKPWLLSIVRNQCRNRLRGQARLIPLDEGAGEAPGPSPQDMAIRSWEGESVRDAIESLPLEYREAIVLRELEDMGYKQIAEVAGIPIGTVMSRLARARNLLRECLSVSEEAK